MPVETRKSFCRICTASCAINVDVENNRVINVRGDSSDPLSGGYTCIKGRNMAHQIHGAKRLTTPLKRLPDGSFKSISAEQAMDEIAERLLRIIDTYGKRSVASFCGTAAYLNSISVPLIQAWHQGLGSPSNYSTMTLDQPAKIVALSRMGLWGGGAHAFATAHVVMCIGINPMVSGLAMIGGPPCNNPYKSIHEAKRRGLKLICVDPRRTELAEIADIHLQIRPGEDTALLAGFLRIILKEDLHDKDFCREYATGLEELIKAVDAFTPEYVSKRTDLPELQIIEAARLFAKGPRGVACSGTGPDFGRHNCLNEHLIATLNIVCGRFNRQGEKLVNPGVLSDSLPRPAQVIPPELLPPFLVTGKGPVSRINGLHQLCNEMPACTLSDEILEPGEGQIRALITSCANPAVAMPDQEKMVRALEDLELSVCIELELTATSRRADYIIASRHALEREDITSYMDMFYESPYAFYTKAAIEPPAETMEDWQFFLGLAKRLNFAVTLPGGTIQPGQSLTKFEVLKLLKPDTKIPLDTIYSKGQGHIFDDLEVFVDAPIPGLDARFQLTPPGISEEIMDVYSEGKTPESSAEKNADFTHLLISRRLKHVNNSYGHTNPELRKKGTTNYAYMNSADLHVLGLSPEDLIEIESAHGAIIGVVQPTDEVKRGVISMSHCWGGTPDQKLDVREFGANTNRLIKYDHDFEPITGLARMTAIPVNVRPYNNQSE